MPQAVWLTFAAPRTPAPVADHCWPVPPQEILKHRSGSVSVGSLGLGAHKILFEPSESLSWFDHFMGNRWGNSGNSVRLYFLGSKIIADGDCSHEIKRRLLLGSETMKNLDSLLKRHYFASEGLFSQSCDFSRSHVWMWELDYKESWVPKNWCFWTMVLEKTLESPLDCKEIQPVHPKGDQPWDLFGRTDVEAETPILWPPDGKSWLIWKDPDAGKDWRQEEKGTTEDEMAGWHHWHNGHGFV